ncbi:MAG: hypothetical protein QGI46_01350 [Planctomycetota bacterium]|jgi:hypothetical protein|nr:hypothetical protein [Planctomycetota bacterium]
MSVLAVARWMALHTLRRPIAWVGLVACLGIWQLARRLGPLGSGADATELLYEVAFLASLLGALLALSALGECEWFLLRLARPRRLAARAAGLFAGGAGALALALLAPLSVSLLRPEPSPAAPDPGTAIDLAWSLNLSMGLFGLLAHLTVVGTLLLQAPLSTTQRTLALPSLTWILPALIGSEGWWAARLVRLLDPSRHLAAAAGATGPGADSLLPVAALTLCAWAMTARPPATAAMRLP